MANLKLESLVQPVVRVACDVVAGLERSGSKQASGRTTATPLSFPRHLSPADPDADMAPAPRYEHANANGYGVAHAAQRAGRPGSLAGVLGSRSPAITAGRAILSGWSLISGGVHPARRTGLTAGAREIPDWPLTSRSHA